MSIKPYGDDVHQYIRRMEQAIIASLADVGVEAGLIEGLTGVWTREPRKIASIGVHISRGVTTHGFAINVNNDLQPFEWIVPCGIDNCRMTSVARELHAAFDMERFMDIVEREIGVAYGRLPVREDDLMVAA
jgi:lipoyl(octanoyl) transferase